jgi:hypothetical protein
MVYSFHDLKRRPWGQSLPTDVNEKPESICNRIGDSIALEELKNGKEKRLYEDISCYDKKGTLIATFYMQSGIVPSWHFYEYRPDGLTLFKRSVFNERITMKKEKQGHDAENSTDD